MSKPSVNFSSIGWYSLEPKLKFEIGDDISPENVNGVVRVPCVRGRGLYCAPIQTKTAEL